MKSHDFGQFLFNSSVFDENKLVELITAAKNIEPTLATRAIFLRLVSLAELTEGAENLDDLVKKILSPHQIERANRQVNDNSLKLVQALIDTGTADSKTLEKILQDYHRIEIPPVESAFANFYDSAKDDIKIDYPLALNVAESLHEFISETFNTSVIYVSAYESDGKEKFGASVKIQGVMPVVVAVVAEQNIFHKMANLYDDFVSDDLDEDFDAISEMLNVFTGNFTVQFAASVGVEEEPEPPRFGRADKNLQAMRVLTDFGNFYIYIGKEEIFACA